ncbi:M1 family metallopeptidase [Acidipila sp. EB88]|uniref:M1 family metallopeptidase n=1 Tax=Acidipila sp. EB88 TaxID=2305226 RepID=UPI000F5F903B|nr:M1 family metallopeptidase [Acidipila sp. EB88]RRA47698.1 M1 family peptidase [Acidipila sp. EB88]
MFVSQRSQFLAALVLVTAGSAGSLAQRLPVVATPQHYQLALTPDLAKATFTGQETIDLVLQAPASTITLNAADITFQTVSADGQTAQVSEDANKEQATFAFAKPLPAGHVALKIQYAGVLNSMLRGFYLSKTAKRNYAVTQFEPTDARRAFPSFDEPAYKATFDVSLTVDKGDTAISNTNVVSDTPANGGTKHTLRFATTPKMSTYLVAFLVGDFVCTSGESDGVPIRACATPDKLALTPYAVKAAEFVLHYYDTYFGIKYPMPKLDMIAIPDFEAGAMENFGAITYRETDFLVDENHASDGAKQTVAMVVAHEMAHQWFGDMVTMQWWNNLWLNEGFATWMESKPVAAWHPEWNIPEHEAASLDSTLALDAQAVTRTIRAEANTPDEINEMFDGITYQKGGAVLGMVESYLGKEQFRKGVHNYLQAHMFGNATAEDFWGAQTAASGKPVDKIMESFIGQPGVPLLSFSEPASGHVTATQTRFYGSAAAQQAHASDPAQSWTVPVCIKGGAQDCPLLSSASGSLPVAASPLFFANARGEGYYRSEYPTAVEQKLVEQVETGLTPAERISLIGDQWAQVRAGKAKIGGTLDLAVAAHSDASAAVTGTMLSALRSINARLLATPAERQKFAMWVRATYKPQLATLGMPAANEAPNTSELRAELFGLVGGIGQDPQTIAQAKQLVGQYMQDQNSVQPTLLQAAAQVAAQHGDATFFSQLQHVFETDNNPQHAEQALGLLASFEDPALTERAMAYAASSKVRNQDAIGVFGRALNSPATRDAAWAYIQNNWPAVSAQLTEMNGGYIVRAAGSFCSAEKADEVKNFFTAHPVHASARGFEIAQAQIKDCVEFRSAQQANLESWLAAHGQ